MINFVRALCIVLFAAAVAACGKSDNEWTPLHDDAAAGGIAEVKRLTDSGANLDAKNDKGYTLLLFMAGLGETDIALALIDAGADVNATADNEGGLAPLHAAIAEGHADIVLALINAGADVGIKDNKDGTPLQYAAGYAQTEIALALIKAGADVDDTALGLATQLHGKDSNIARTLQKAAK